MNEKKELQVAALENGTVIDHIPSEKLFTVVSLLGLEHMNNNITIGFNLNSKKLGKKGIIKIADKFFCDDEINRIAVVAPNVKLNIIRNYEVVEKREVKLPDELRGIVKCANPKCITNNEPMPTRFHVIDRAHAHPLPRHRQGTLRHQVPLLREGADEGGNRDYLIENVMPRFSPQITQIITDVLFLTSYAFSRNLCKSE